jgi:hypothetical protein
VKRLEFLTSGNYVPLMRLCFNLPFGALYALGRIMLKLIFLKQPLSIAAAWEPS